ncbi:hypothetical protein RHSIM_Rhsim09G0079800 [Rhododendron simsii]|uniref:Retroviral polymerase SH3-like domain-containing protein n=1 Tax=Rhododendron simsii TaxID=118357 RepID=A0A834GHM6_RHOSS|nr:hypothetical protein RHSIM_Rhsim09G0079800 [Rhododendron simsii]
MLCENSLPKYFWAEAVNTSCYVLNRVLIRPILKKTPYELWNSRKPNISYFHAFGCKCFVLNNEKDDLGKFDSKSDEGIFIGYLTSSKAYRVYNKRTNLVEKSIYVSFDESNPCSPKIINDNDDDVIATKEINDLTINEKEVEATQEESSQTKVEEVINQPQDVNGDNQDLPKEWRYVQNHPKELILDDPSKGRPVGGDFTMQMFVRFDALQALQNQMLAEFHNFAIAQNSRFDRVEHRMDHIDQAQQHYFSHNHRQYPDFVPYPLYHPPSPPQ